MLSLKANKGSAVLTTPLVIVISMFLLGLLVVFIVNMLTSFIWYEKLSSQSLKYIFIMEEYGYLTSQEKDNLKEDLKLAGFDEDKTIISATDIPAQYGEPIFLNISYDYKMVLPVLKRGVLAIENKEDIVRMNVRKQSVSKR